VHSHERSAAAILGGIVALLCLWACTDPIQPEWFPENTRFGYVLIEDDTTIRGREYLVVQATEGNPGAPVTLARIRSTTPPQMCDTNAVTYIAPDGDEDQLMVLMVSDTICYDTVMSFPPYHTSGGGRTVFPDTCIYSPQTYCLAWRDSVLVYETTSLHRRTVFEIVRIRPSGRYTSVQWEMGQFSMSDDFSQILIARGSGPPLPDEEMSRVVWLMAYDLVDDSLLPLSNDFRLGGPLRRLSRNSPLYCLRIDSTHPGSHLCVLTENGEQMLTSFEWPEFLSRYQVRRDSVVVWYRQYADPAFGERRTAIPTY
jgi:hypothetical protein